MIKYIVKICVLTFIIIYACVGTSEPSVEIKEHTEPQVIVEEVVVEEPVLEIKLYYDIPLSNELQDCAEQIASEFNIPLELMLAVMDKETGGTFQTDLISSTNDYGVMQINRSNHRWLQKDLGVTNFLNPYENMRCGAYMISNLYSQYDNLNQLLMVYNMGGKRAKELWSQGIYSTQYSREVVSKYEAYRRAEKVDRGQS